MALEELADREKDSRRGNGRGRGHSPRGAKTFRRGRALAFLEGMKLKRSTIQQQLDKPEFEPIQQVLLGELKAIDMVISEFTQLFEIHQDELDHKDSAAVSAVDEKTRPTEEKGAAEHEEN